MSAPSRSGPENTGATGSDRAGVRLRLGVGAGVGLVLIAAVVAIIVTVSASSGASEWVDPDESTEAMITAPGSPLNGEVGGGGADVDPAPGAVFVHVLGAVEHPGLYQLSDGARVVDVIAAAGGVTEDADPGGVNLARVVGDGEQLYVPAVGEDVPRDEGAGAASVGTAGGLININRASLAELDLLPRVGPALAQRIIDWREAYGAFSSIDDLKSVTGIGEKTFAGLKDLVTT